MRHQGISEGSEAQEILSELEMVRAVRRAEEFHTVGCKQGAGGAAGRDEMLGSGAPGLLWLDAQRQAAVAQP